MAAHTSFKAILEEKIQAQGGQASPSESPFMAQDPAHLSYLLGTLTTHYFRPRTGKIYPGRPKAPSPPHKLTEEQQESVSFFATHGARISPAFSRKELKKAFRGLALRLHPDMNKGASGPFVQLQLHYNRLANLFS